MKPNTDLVIKEIKAHVVNLLLESGEAIKFYFTF